MCNRVLQDLVLSWNKVVEHNRMQDWNTLDKADDARLAPLAPVFRVVADPICGRPPVR
jgi:hypothetical protein